MAHSVILPAHNEESILRETIRSNYGVGASEVLFGLDRCTDSTFDLVKRVAELYPDVVTRVIRYGDRDGVDWRFRSAYLRRDLYSRAENPVIVNTSADINLDPIIGRYAEMIPHRYALTSFHYYEKPWTIQCFERALISSVRSGFAGLLAVSRDAWLDSEDMDHLKTIPRGEDTHLRLAVGAKYPTHHFHTRSLHLRPNEDFMDHYYRGQALYDQVHHSNLKAFLHSVFMLRPAVYAGFCHAQRGLKR